MVGLASQHRTEALDFGLAHANIPREVLIGQDILVVEVGNELDAELVKCLGVRLQTMKIEEVLELVLLFIFITFHHFSFCFEEGG